GVASTKKPWSAVAPMGGPIPASLPGASSAPEPISAPCPAVAFASTAMAMSCGAAVASIISPIVAATPSCGSEALLMAGLDPAIQLFGDAPRIAGSAPGHEGLLGWRPREDSNL